MAGTIVSSYTATTQNDALTRYLAIDGGLVANTSETGGVQLPVQAAGTASKLLVRVTSNTHTTAASTFTSRINAGAGSMSISVAAAATGDVEDTSNSDSLAVGDLYNVMCVTGANAGTTSIVYVLVQVSFAPTTAGESLMQCLARAAVARTLNAVSRYVVPVGEGGSDFDTEADAKLRIDIDVETSRLWATTYSNSRSTATTVDLRVNGADGNQTVSIASSTTGVFVDTTRTDSISSGDDVCIEVNYGASGETIRWAGFGMKVYDASTSAEIIGCSDQALTDLAAGVTNYTTANGRFVKGITTESSVRIIARETRRVDRLNVLVKSNAADGATTCKTYVDGSLGNLSISIPASTTGLFQDASNYDSLIDGRPIDLQWASAASTGLMYPSYASVIVAAEPVASTHPGWWSGGW